MEDKSKITYGQILILGYNGFLPQGDKGRRRSKFVLYKRPEANGVRRSRHYIVQSPQTSKAILDAIQHSISFTTSRENSVIVEYEEDANTDMFQIGRSSESPIDFVIMDTLPGDKMESKISRFACRIVVDRGEPSKARIYAAGFNSSRNIFLGENAAKWQESDVDIDGLTTNGILVMHPKGQFVGGKTKSLGIFPWRECSVGGNMFGLREYRSAHQKGEPIPSETNILRDGTLLDFDGATLLWRSTEGLEKSTTEFDLEKRVDEINEERLQCPVGFNTLVIPRRGTSSEHINQPNVCLKCGHVQDSHDWGKTTKSTATRRCPLCPKQSNVVTLRMGWETAFYLDSGPLTHAFNPCGHMTTEKTVRYWAKVRIPHESTEFQAVCPFCATPLAGRPGFVKLIFPPPLPQEAPQLSLNLEISNRSINEISAECIENEKKERKRKSNEHDEERRKRRKLLQEFVEFEDQANQSNQVEYIDLMDWTDDDILNTFPGHHKVLKKAFKKYLHVPNASESNYLLILSKIVSKLQQHAMYGKLRDVFCRNCDAITCEYENLIWKLLLPEWGLQIFMRRFELSRPAAIEHLKKQDRQRTAELSLGFDLDST